MANIPQWAQKPKHKKKVIATNRGWEVESTGEVLKRVNNLPERLESLFDQVDEVRASVRQEPQQPVQTIDLTQVLPTLGQVSQSHSGTGDNVAGDKTEVATTTEQEQQTAETTTDAETGTETETEAKEEQKPARKKPGPKPKTQRKKPGPKPKKQGNKGQ